MVSPDGPGLILMGGGTDVDAAFVWQRSLAAGGDVVVLRTSGSDGYNDYLYTDIGGFDSVETLRVDSRALANDPYVSWALRHAEAIFLAGGDQATYMEYWAGTAVQDALAAAWSRGAVIGGTSAGCAIMGAQVFTASNGTVYSDEALADPYNEYMTLGAGYVAPPPMSGVITDTHFRQRDRMGRLLAFTARMIADGTTKSPLGLGVDEATALLVDAAGNGRVAGSGAVYVVAPAAAPATCVAEQPLVFADVPVYTLQDGDTIALPSGVTSITPSSVSASGGMLSPAAPY